MDAAPHRRGANWVRLIDRCCSRCVLSAALACVVTPAGASGQNDPTAAPEQAVESGEDDEASLYQSGLVARYTGSDGVEHVRLEEQIAFAWGDRSAGSPRCGAARSRPSFAVICKSDRPALTGCASSRPAPCGSCSTASCFSRHSSREPAWLDAESIELPFGHLPLEVRYRRVDEAGAAGAVLGRSAIRSRTDHRALVVPRNRQVARRRFRAGRAVGASAALCGVPRFAGRTGSAGRPGPQQARGQPIASVAGRSAGRCD